VRQLSDADRKGVGGACRSGAREGGTVTVRRRSQRHATPTTFWPRRIRAECQSRRARRSGTGLPSWGLGAVRVVIEVGSTNDSVV